MKYSDGGRKAIFIGGFGYFENRQSGGFVGFLSFLLPCAGNGMSQCRLRHSGLDVARKIEWREAQHQLATKTALTMALRQTSA
ncbi:hypothetical protein [Agrobacterium pusense]|uniref:hypothetical protein n=1 Tax=Agrobacterium pusense TaxID=648995 RepID=UPI0010ADE839|nr:hypothetical protein [Agrobacterium pusense]WCK27045.1 hypothetical protein CFBP5496_0022905 [Agrobacterium pusense]